MKHFVLKDINPEKVIDFNSFLKEMNDMVVLISVANAPYVDGAKVEIESESGDTILSLFENDFHINFKGKKVGEKVVSGYFELLEKKVKRMEVTYTIGEINPIALRTKLNCEGEDLVREEFYTVFERDFSHQAHQYMKTPLEEINEINQKKSNEIAEPTIGEIDEIEERAMDQVIEELEQNNEVEEQVKTAPEEVEKTEDDEITEELNELSEKVLNSIIDVREIIINLSQTCHDLTRGATLDFTEEELQKQILPNGASIEMIDADENGYKITFRKGSSDDLSEISFFLEKEDELVFSLYLSSTGIGRISTSSEQSHIVFKKVKSNLL